jgi:hypothetical protein
MAAFFATLAPWVIRNAITNGNFGIVNRAADVLGVRMLLTEEDSLGMIYTSSPSPLKEQLGPLLGYAPADLKAGTRIKAEGYRGNVKPWLRRALSYPSSSILCAIFRASGFSLTGASGS